MIARWHATSVLASVALVVSCRSPSPAPPNAPPATADTGSHASSLAFRTYQQPWSRFAPGDAIDISGVYGKTPGCVPGEEYIVTGRYKLESHERAVLAVYATNGELAQQDNLHVAAGRGKFRFRFTVRKAGMLHVTFYPEPTGDGFGGMYFDCR